MNILSYYFKDNDEFYLSGRNGTHSLPFPPKIWTGEMTRDLREAYDDNAPEIKVKCKGTNNYQIQVCLRSRNKSLFHYIYALLSKREVKMARYWPSSFFVFFSSSRYIKSKKKKKR